MSSSTLSVASVKFMASTKDSIRAKIDEDTVESQKNYIGAEFKDMEGKTYRGRLQLKLGDKKDDKVLFSGDKLLLDHLIIRGETTELSDEKDTIPLSEIDMATFMTMPAEEAIDTNVKYIKEVMFNAKIKANLDKKNTETIAAYENAKPLCGFGVTEISPNPNASKYEKDTKITLNQIDMKTIELETPKLLTAEAILSEIKTPDLTESFLAKKAKLEELSDNNRGYLSETLKKSIGEISS